MSELVVVTTYYNPCGYVSRRKNFDLFREALERQNIACITLECAFGDAPFELPPSLDTIQIRSKTVLWQKERLLNLAASWLPPSCKVVAWLDCDIIHHNDDWGKDLCRLMKTHMVAQTWQTCTRLLQGNIVGDNPDIAESFASVMNKTPETLDAGRYDLHGHTGYGWAMRRELFDKVGLYEHAISGSADHFMAHAIYGDYNFCIQNALKHDPRQISHLRAWGDRFYKLVQGSLCVVPGHIDHYWHGDTVNRRYFLRMHEITTMGFDPWTDLSIKPGLPIEWAEGLDKPLLKEYFIHYFESRSEDGVGDNTKSIENMTNLVKAA